VEVIQIFHGTQQSLSRVLRRLGYSQLTKRKKYPIKKAHRQNAIYTTSTNGPCFGQDLRIVLTPKGNKFPNTTMNILAQQMMTCSSNFEAQYGKEENDIQSQEANVEKLLKTSYESQVQALMPTISLNSLSSNIQSIPLFNQKLMQNSQSFQPLAQQIPNYHSMLSQGNLLHSNLLHPKLASQNREILAGGRMFEIEEIEVYYIYLFKRTVNLSLYWIPSFINIIEL